MSSAAGDTSVGTSVVEAYRFGYLGDADHDRLGVVEVKTYELFSGTEPMKDGLFDPRMGTTDHAFRCGTCLLEKRHDLGHAGKRHLRVPCIGPLAIAEMRLWLKVVCLSCGAPGVDPARYAHVAADRRLAAAADSRALQPGWKCANCGKVHPLIRRDDQDHFSTLAIPATLAKASADMKAAQDADSAFREKHLLLSTELKRIFERVTDDTVVALGKSLDVHPRRFLHSVIAIPPVTVRPGVRSFGAGSAIAFHDITTVLQHLLKRDDQNVAEAGVGRLDEANPAVSRGIQTQNMLYYSLLMGSSASAAQGDRGRRDVVVGGGAAVALMQRWPLKRGRIRTDLLGKRVFFISRVTISGDNSLKINQVGVPLVFARKLQIPERVQEHNRDWLTRFYVNGKDVYPGCTRVQKASGAHFDVDRMQRSSPLEIGDVLWRDIITGDVVFFNRQPSLERSSTVAMEAVVNEDATVRTFRMNVVACSWFNADFDGDAMLLHAPQSEAARAEARVVSSPTTVFISTKSGSPVNGQVQDSIVGCAELTRSNVRMGKYHALALFQSIGSAPPDVPGGADATFRGGDVVSLLLERTPVNCRRKPSFYEDIFAPFIPYTKEEIGVEIVNGQLRHGVLDKATVGAGASGGVSDLISREYGPGVALDFVFALQQVSLQFLMKRGFTVSAADMAITPRARGELRDIYMAMLAEAQAVTDRLRRGQLVPPIGMSVREFYEKSLLALLSPSSSDVIRWVLHSMRKRGNGMLDMVSYKSKGSVPNLIHIMAFIGQVSLNGERLRERFSFRRTSPYYPRFSTDPCAYGLIANSYVSGMTSVEFIAADMVGRYDLISKALSTATTGYFMRKGVMCNQSSIVDNHRRVVKNRRVVQFLYGDDGLDVRSLVKAELRTVKASDADVRKIVTHFGVDAKITGELGGALDEALAAVMRDRAEYREIFTRVERNNFKRPLSADVMVPVDVVRVLRTVYSSREGPGRSEKHELKSEAAPLARAPAFDEKMLLVKMQRVRELCDNFAYLHLNAIQEARRARVPPHLAAAVRHMVSLLRVELAPPVLAGLADSELSYVIAVVRTRYQQAFVSYGSAVGILACQAVSEPLTQYMLDSHHRSVAGGTNKAGVQRVEEIYSARPVSAEKSSAMFLPIRHPICLDRARVEEIASNIEYMVLRDVVQRDDILLEPHDRLVYPPFLGDAEWMDEFRRNNPLMPVPADITSKCLRVVVEKKKLVHKSASLLLILRALYRNPDLFVFHTPESVPAIVLRIYLRAAKTAARRAQTESEAALEAVLDTPLRGVVGIVRATVEEVPRTRGAPDGSLRVEKEFGITTVGTNLAEVMLNPNVVQREVISTSVGDTGRMFGILSARNKIVTETRGFMGDGTPNLRHLDIYACEMTRTGRVTAIERQGLKAREPNDVLQQVAFGAPKQVIQDATLRCAEGAVHGGAAPQILGASPMLGTLYNQCVMDEAFVAANVRSLSAVLDELH